MKYAKTLIEERNQLGSFHTFHNIALPREELYSNFVSFGKYFFTPARAGVSGGVTWEFHA
jgi:hypothetical protein